MPADDRFVMFSSEATALAFCAELDRVLGMPWEHPGRQNTLRWDIPWQDASGRWVVTIERRIEDEAYPRGDPKRKARVRKALSDADLALVAKRPARPVVAVD